MPRPTRDEITAIHDQPFMDLVFKAASVHREHHDPNQVAIQDGLDAWARHAAASNGFGDLW